MVLRTMLSDRLNDLRFHNSAAEAGLHSALGKNAHCMEHSLSPISSRLLGEDHCSLMMQAALVSIGAILVISASHRGGISPMEVA